MNRVSFLRNFLVCVIPVASGLFFHTAESAEAAGRQSRHEVGGHLKMRASTSWPERGSLYGLQGLDPYYDGSLEFRLTGRYYMSDDIYVDVHYESVFTGGDTRRLQHCIGHYGAEMPTAFGAMPDDRGRLFSLTDTLDTSGSAVWYHRIDRCVLTLLPAWGVIRIGRQALTWGNGLIFNSMDLFNPFRPTDIEREYKIGDDMALAQFYAAGTDCQVLFVPRRDRDSRKLEWGRSSLAFKVHGTFGVYEWDLLAAGHYKDVLLGGGCVGYLGSAAWRVDTVLTLLGDHDRDKDAFLTLTANIDCSWVLWERNMYGFVECYINTLPSGGYPDALDDPAVVERLERGGLFTLGELYISGHLRFEIHPLVNILATLIANVEDPSGIIQPRVVWDVTRNMRITAGANLYFGGPETEYGGFRLPEADTRLSPASGAFVWINYYF